MGPRRSPWLPHAEAVAAHLHAAYGDLVALSLGALPYPARTDATAPPSPRDTGGERTPADPAEKAVALDGPLSVRSGWTAEHAVLLTNLSPAEIRLYTNGYLTASIVAVGTGDVVGGFDGVQEQPLVVFTAAPAQTVRIPLLVGTASCDPALGYAVPAGRWQLTAPLDLADVAPQAAASTTLPVSGCRVTVPG